VAEYAVPSTFTLPDDANLTDAVFGNAAEFPDNVAFDRKVDGSWQPVTSKTFAEDVKAVAPAVLAHRVTLRPELWMSEVTGASVIEGVLAEVETPAAREQLQRPT